MLHERKGCDVASHSDAKRIRCTGSTLIKFNVCGGLVASRAVCHVWAVWSAEPERAVDDGDRRAADPRLAGCIVVMNGDVAGAAEHGALADRVALARAQLLRGQETGERRVRAARHRVFTDTECVTRHQAADFERRGTAGRMRTID